MFFLYFYGLWTSVTFDSSITGDPSKKFWKEDNSDFHMIPVTQISTLHHVTHFLRSYHIIHRSSKNCSLGLEKCKLVYTLTCYSCTCSCYPTKYKLNKNAVGLCTFQIKYCTCFYLGRFRKKLPETNALQ